MFNGRKKELELLEDLYDSKQFEFLVLYGRRRVGKTELLIEFTKNKPYKTTLSEEQMSNLQKLNEKYLEKVEKSTIPIDYCFFYPIFYKKDEEKDPYYILMNCLMKDK